MKKLRDLVDNEVAKNTKFTTLKTKVNILGKKILDATTLIHINQCNTDKQYFKKIEDINRKIPVTSALVTSTIFNIKFTEVENKIPNTSSLVPTTVLNSKIENKKLRIKFLIMKNILVILNLIS